MLSVTKDVIRVDMIHDDTVEYVLKPLAGD